MKTKICKLKLTATESGHVTGVRCRTSFNGDLMDMACIISAIFQAWELDTEDVDRVCLMAAKLTHPDEEAEE